MFPIPKEIPELNSICDFCKTTPNKCEAKFQLKWRNIDNDYSR